MPRFLRPSFILSLSLSRDALFRSFLIYHHTRRFFYTFSLHSIWALDELLRFGEEFRYNVRSLGISIVRFRIPICIIIFNFDHYNAFYNLLRQKKKNHFYNRLIRLLKSSSLSLVYEYFMQALARVIFMCLAPRDTEI